MHLRPGNALTLSYTFTELAKKFTFFFKGKMLLRVIWEEHYRAYKEPVIWKQKLCLNETLIFF